MPFKEVDPKLSFPALEQSVAQWWHEHGVVAQALAAGDRARPFIFFEGPPTANGRPGVHHVEARVTKDLIVRYQRMRGRYVIGARGGWDTHGLPVEVEVEKELGFNGKPDIEKYGIKEFNAKCKESVNRYVDEFERLTDRIAFWLDLDNPYTTYDNSYIESLWWILKQFWDNDLLFRDYKVTMHCPRCGTTLADAEVALGFADDVDDPSVWIRFQHQPGSHPHDAQLAGAAFLAWTTTPWTLPANVAIALKPDADYALVEYTGGAQPERLVLAAARADAVLGAGNYSVLDSFKGDALWGVRYQRLYDGVPGAGDKPDLDRAYIAIADEFVSLDDGTGIVHIAPAYGDLEIGRKYNLPTLFSVDLSGQTYPAYQGLGFGGMFFKQADPLITRNLHERGLLFRSERVRHAYPFCWRCKTPLLYYAKPSWYIRTTAKKERLVAHNQAIHWVPEHIKNGRFGNWLANNIDWAISRERYWGTPLPIWISDDGKHMECIGSVAELEQKVGRSLAELDLHRPYVDELTWPTPDGSGTMRRVADVADAWFDSGAMPVAQWHYPFENRELFEVAGQADYISEAIDQTRGWFYTLHAVSTLLFDRPAFKHVICLGHLLDAKGEKMSKSRGNVADPFALIDQFGADAVRWYMFASAPPYNPRRFGPDQVGEMLRQFMLTLWNTYSFFVTYANLDGWAPSGTPADPATLQPIDRWAHARLHALVRDVTAALDSYDIHAPAKAIEAFADELSNWYVRRNRRRFWKADDDADKQAAYDTLYTCLTTLTRLFAPFMPFLAEAIWQNLVVGQIDGMPQSVHLAAWPQADEAVIDTALLADTAVLLEAISLGRAARRSAGLKVRQPLDMLWVHVPRAAQAGLAHFEAELRDELNVKQVRYLDAATTLVTYRFKPNLRVVGKKYGKLVPALTQALAALAGADARAAAQAIEAGQPLVLTVGEQALALTPDEVLVESVAPAGYAVAEHGGVLVALDTTVTPELRAEGLARELVRSIQDARKAAGLAIADRIAVTLAQADAELAAVVATWAGYLRAETLAETLTLEAPAAGAHISTLDLDGHALTLGITRLR
ncbi:MAG: isoleucine--tRNA ligase [Kouleothrix sp.]|jgi:isoleucyl-tRNA synthetase|nr:isoleucine--tRNA ligase [Kouleothrix sp.]